MSNVLIASLGDSPVVVTAMFDRLRQEKEIDQLIVFYTDNEISLISYEDMIYKPLQRKFPECSIDGVVLDHDDVSSEDASYEFLRKLHAQLNEHQKSGDNVYLSLAGGRKSMGSLMALLAPLFPCVKGLYHILDEDEGKDDHFWTTWRLSGVATEEQKKRLFPSHERVKLIPIPYVMQTISPEVASLLDTITPEQLDELWERDPELAKEIAYYSIDDDDTQGEMLRVVLTKKAAKQYREMLPSGGIHARNFRICFDQLRFEKLRIRNAHREPYKYEGRTFRYYKRLKTAERPVFHIETTAIKEKVVIVSALLIEVEGRSEVYTPLKKLVKNLTFPLEFEDIPSQQDEESQRDNKQEEIILIVPLGIRPMVATQLYQLYIDNGHKVHSVILIHTKHTHVYDSVKIACDAFESIGVNCKAIPLEGWNDIDTPQACAAYQALLEYTIEDTRNQNPSCQIELTISGGRKGMSALATFAAQRLGIRHVVHTVVHKRLSDKVEEETKIEELKKLKRTNNKKKCNDRLFLHAYKENRDAFVLFTIPVLPVQKG